MVTPSLGQQAHGHSLGVREKMSEGTDSLTVAAL